MEGEKRKIFFQQLLEQSNLKIYIFRNKSADSVTVKTPFLGKKAGSLSCLDWNYESRGGLSVGLSFWHDDSNVNKRRFHMLMEEKQEIESAFGEPLKWEYKEGRKYQYVRSYTPEGRIEDETNWPKIQEDLVNRMVRFEKAMRNYINDLDEEKKLKQSISPDSQVYNKEGYLPTREDFESAYKMLTHIGGEIEIDKILEQIEVKAKEAGRPLKNDWRKFTEKNIFDVWPKTKKD